MINFFFPSYGPLNKVKQNINQYSIVTCACQMPCITWVCTQISSKGRWWIML